MFRYALMSAPRLDGAALARLGFDEMRPAETNYVVSQDKVGNPPRPLPPGGEGFLETSGTNIGLVTWKEAEDGDGDILRLQEVAGKAGEVTIHFPHASIASAQLCSGVEDNLRNLPVENNVVRLTFRPFEVQTVRVRSK